MATITLNIPDPVLSRVLDAVAATQGWQSGGQSKAAFAKQHLIDYTKGLVALHEATQAAKQASIDATLAVQTEINIT